MFCFWYRMEVAISHAIDFLTEMVRRPGQQYQPSATLWSTSNASARPLSIIVVTAPLILTTLVLNSMWHLRATLLVLLNVWARLIWPSCYYPATASVSHPVASPLTARLIAFVAEFHFYEVIASCYGLDFWGASSMLWLVVLTGEVVSTCGVILQSELLLFIEDCTWALHGALMAYLTLPSVPLLAWTGYMSLVHLPRRFRIMQRRPQAAAGKCIGFFPKVEIRQCDDDEKAWVVPMLFGQPLLMALCYMYLSANFLGDNLVFKL